MKRREFVKSSVIGAPVVASGLTFPGLSDQPGEKEVIELREYEIVFGGNRGNLDSYLKEALIPALNKYGVRHVGVFSEYGDFEPVKIYLLIPYTSAKDYFEIPNLIRKDENYLKASSDYHKLPPEQKVFDRYHADLMVAFDGMPKLVAGSAPAGLYELRTYEGYSEDAVQRKVRMFNEVELDIFKKVGLKPVFFGEVVAGKDLPFLTYMVAFADMEERDEIWGIFGADPDWLKVRSDPQFANTVSKIIKKFLLPLPYSQV